MIRHARHTGDRLPCWLDCAGSIWPRSRACGPTTTPREAQRVVRSSRDRAFSAEMRARSTRCVRAAARQRNPRAPVGSDAVRVTCTARRSNGAPRRHVRARAQQHPPITRALEAKITLLARSCRACHGKAALDSARRLVSTSPFERRNAGRLCAACSASSRGRPLTALARRAGAVRGAVPSPAVPLVRCSKAEREVRSKRRSSPPARASSEYFRDRHRSSRARTGCRAAAAPLPRTEKPEPEHPNWLGLQNRLDVLRYVPGLGGSRASRARRAVLRCALAGNTR